MVHQMLQERKEVNDLEADQHIHSQDVSSQPVRDIEFIREKVTREKIMMVFKKEENLPAEPAEPVDPHDVVSEKYQCTSCGRWETLLPGFNLARTVTFLTRVTDHTELLLFSSASSKLPIELQKHNNKVLIHKSSSQN